MFCGWHTSTQSWTGYIKAVEKTKGRLGISKDGLLTQGSAYKTSQAPAFLAIPAVDEHGAEAARKNGKKSGGNVDWQGKLEIWMALTGTFFIRTSRSSCVIFSPSIYTFMSHSVSWAMTHAGWNYWPSLISYSLVVCQLQSLPYPINGWIWLMDPKYMSNILRWNNKNIENHTPKQYFNTTFNLVLHK